MASAQFLRSLEPKLGLEVGAYISGDDLTTRLRDHRIMPSVSTYLDVPLQDGFHAQGWFNLGMSYNTAYNIGELKDYNYRFQDLTYETMYAAVAAGPEYELPSFLDKLSTRAGLLAGLISKETRLYQDNLLQKDHWASFFIYGLSLAAEYPVTNTIDLRLSYRGFYTTTDMLDGLASGSSHDGFSIVSVGVSWNSWEAPSSLPGMELSRRSDGVDASNRVGETGVSVDPIRSFSELVDHPTRMLLRARLAKPSALPVQVVCEFRRGGTAIARSVREATLHGPDITLRASDFVDFDGMSVENGYDGTLPEATYTVHVTVIPPLQSPVACSGEFQSVDLARHFGDARATVDSMLRDGTARVTISQNGNVILHLFPEAGNAPTAGEGPFGAGTDGSGATGDGRLARGGGSDAYAASARMTPEGLDSTYRFALLDAKANGAFFNALAMRRAISARRKTGAVIAVIYFSEMSAMLEDEGRVLLDNVSRKFRAHPNLHFELRGYAGDCADPVYNTRLSEQRALRVYDYLARKIVPTSVLSTLAIGGADFRDTGNPRDRQLYRKVEIVLVEDDETPPAKRENEAGNRRIAEE